MNRLIFSLFFLIGLGFASQMATTYNGATVILHDDGRWEYYQNNEKCEFKAFFYS